MNGVSILFLICVSFIIVIAGIMKPPTETTLVHSVLVALLHGLYYPHVHACSYALNF